MPQVATLTVLIVDDIPLMRTMLAKYVRTLGKSAFRCFRDDVDIEVCEASNGRSALEVARSRPVDVIFLDLMMPDMDGLAFLSHRLDDPRLGKVPVIVCSAVSETETIDRARELGADDYISKPFTLKIVEEKLRSLLPTYVQGQS